MSLQEKPPESPERTAYYERIERRCLTPLWSVLSGIITPEPRSGCQPHAWQFDEVKALLLEAGNLISAKEAERRVLILENPGLRGQSRITTSLYAGLQLVRPGEVAPAHRHSQSAIRFVLDGAGAHTTVDGERTRMQVGDFVITPAGAWHAHGNGTDEPMIWLDGLDIPTVSLFDASFAESFPEDEQPVTRAAGYSLACYGANMLPVDHRPSQPHSPVFTYPYERTRAALETLRAGQDWDACHGIKMRYANPADGGSPLPTISAFMQLLPAGFETAPYRSTDATVLAVVEGHGLSTVGGTTFRWGPKDIVVVPSWKWVSHRADSDAVVFSYSDRVAQQKLGFWREDRGNNH